MVITKKLNKFMRTTVDYLVNNPQVFQEKLAQGDINVLKLFFSIAEKYMDLEKGEQAKVIPKQKKLSQKEIEALLEKTDELYINYERRV